MRRAGRSFEEFCEAVRTDPRTASWHAEKGIADGGRELDRIWKAGTRTPVARADWISRAQSDRQGEPRPNLYNAMLALREDARVSDLFSYDEMLRAPILRRPVPGGPVNAENELFQTRPVRDADVTALQELLQASGLEKVGKDTVHQAVDLRADEREVSSRPRLSGRAPMGWHAAPCELARYPSRRRGHRISPPDRLHVSGGDGRPHFRARMQGGLHADL